MADHVEKDKIETLFEKENGIPILEGRLLKAAGLDKWHTTPYCTERKDIVQLIEMINDDVVEDIRLNCLVNFFDLVNDASEVEPRILEFSPCQIGVIMLTNVALKLRDRNVMFVDSVSHQVAYFVGNATRKMEAYITDGCNWYGFMPSDDELKSLMPGETVLAEFDLWNKGDVDSTFFNPIINKITAGLGVVTLYDVCSMKRSQFAVNRDILKLEEKPIAVLPRECHHISLPAQSPESLRNPRSTRKYYTDYHSDGGKVPFLAGYTPDEPYIRVERIPGWDHVDNRKSVYDRILAPYSLAAQHEYSALPILNISLYDGDKRAGKHFATIHCYISRSKKHSAKFLQFITTYTNPVPASALQSEVYMFSSDESYAYVQTRGMYNQRFDIMPWLSKTLDGKVYDSVCHEIYRAFKHCELVSKGDPDALSVEIDTSAFIHVFEGRTAEEINDLRHMLWYGIAPITRFALARKNFRETRSIRCEKIFDFTARCVDVGMIQLGCGFVTSLCSPTLHWHSCMN